MTQRSSAKGKKRRKKPEKLEFVQDFIPIKDLRHGIIETTDGRYIKILEIEPINFMLRSDDEQFSIISTFASWLKISPMKLPFAPDITKCRKDEEAGLSFLFFCLPSYLLYRKFRFWEEQKRTHIHRTYVRWMCAWA